MCLCAEMYFISIMIPIEKCLQGRNIQSSFPLLVGTWEPLRFPGFVYLLTYFCSEHKGNNINLNLSLQRANSMPALCIQTSEICVLHGAALEPLRVWFSWKISWNWSLGSST